MTHLVVLGLDSREDAEKVIQLTEDLAKQQLLQREDAALAYKDAKGKVRIHQTMSLTAPAAASGALWGTLIGLIFLNPIAGMAVGAASGAIAGHFSDRGVDDEFMKQLGAELGEGKAALILLVREVTVDKILPEIKIPGTVIQTSLSNEDESQLQAALDAAK